MGHGPAKGWGGELSFVRVPLAGSYRHCPQAGRASQGYPAILAPAKLGAKAPQTALRCLLFAVLCSSLLGYGFQEGRGLVLPIETLIAFALTLQRAGGGKSTDITIFLFNRLCKDEYGSTLGVVAAN
jgi:hypothetical protein